MNEPRLVDVTRTEPARFIDDPTFYDEYHPAASPTPTTTRISRVPDRSPVYCAAIDCKPGDLIVVTFEPTIEGEVAEGSSFFLNDRRMDVAADAFCSTTCEESGSKPTG